MNSWEEDALFEEYGWEKDLIQRLYRAPSGTYITFDTVMGWTDSEQGEEELKRVVARYGQKVSNS